jgi:hypothetical protein
VYHQKDSHELPRDVLNKMQQDLIHSANSRPRMNNFDTYEPLKFNDNSRTVNFFQMVSNSVLIVILMVVLLFMIFVACFLLVTMFKRNTVIKKPRKQEESAKSKITCGERVKSFLKNVFKTKAKLNNQEAKEIVNATNLTV